MKVTRPSASVVMTASPMLARVVSTRRRSAARSPRHAPGGRGGPVGMAVGDEDRADDDVEGGAEQSGRVGRGRSDQGTKRARPGHQGERHQGGPSPPEPGRHDQGDVEGDEGLPLAEGGSGPACGDGQEDAARASRSGRARGGLRHRVDSAGLASRCRRSVRRSDPCRSMSSRFPVRCRRRPADRSRRGRPAACPSRPWPHRCRATRQRMGVVLEYRATFTAVSRSRPTLPSTRRDS